MCRLEKRSLSRNGLVARDFSLPAILGVALVVFLWPLTASAQQPSEAVRAGERIQQELQERQRQQLLEDARKRKEAPPIKVPDTPRSVAPDGGTCREIREIVLIGVTLISKTQQNQLIQPYLNRCLTASDIEALLGNVIKAYIERGNIAARPYIRAQDLSSGRLEILVVEGKVESILLNDGDQKSINLSTAFPWVVGQPLNLRDIEQGLDQINRLASNSATMEILPGATAGDSVIAIANKPAFPLGFSLSADNLGSESTGKDQLGATLNFDNPLSLNDFFTMTRRESLTPDRSKRVSIMDSVYYSVPFGYALFSLSYNDSNYRTPVKLLSGTMLKSTGNSESVTAKLDWVGYRDQVQKLTESIAITQKENKNFLEGQLLEVSSRKLVILDLDLAWNRFFEAGTLNLGLGYSRGVKMLGALRDTPDLRPDSPRAQGEKFRYSASLFVPFKLGGVSASFSSQFSGQYALDPLYGSEQLLIGSYYTVRGFVKNSLSGDRAHYVRNEVALALPIDHITLRPYVGLDYGRVQAFRNTPAGELWGVAAGFRISSKYVNGDIAVVQPLNTPRGASKEVSQLFASLSLNF